MHIWSTWICPLYPQKTIAFFDVNWPVEIHEKQHTDLWSWSSRFSSVALKALYRKRNSRESVAAICTASFPPSDPFTGGYLLGVPWAQGFLVVQVHLACPEMKTETASSSGHIIPSHFSKNKQCLVVGAWALCTLWNTDKVNISIYLQVLLFHLVCHLFPFFQADPADHENRSFIVSDKGCDHMHNSDYLHCSDYVDIHAVHQIIFLTIKPGRPGGPWIPLRPSLPWWKQTNKQTQTGHRHQRKKKWLMATITTQAGWPAS